jgi:hypothetical protein
MPHNFAHFTNEMVPFIDQLQSGEITPDQFRQAMQNVETQQQDPLDMGTDTGALSNLDQSSTGQPNVSQSSAIDPNVPQPVAEDLGPHGSPQPLPTTLYGSDYSLENLVGGQVERLYLKDPSTGRIYDYDYSESEFKNYVPFGLQFDDLELVKAIGSRNDNKFAVDIDPTKYEFGGRRTPEEIAESLERSNRDDPSDNDVFYDYNGRTYVDVSGTGQGIPVGSTNITRDPTQLGQYDNEGNYTKFDSSTYTSPVLDKTFEGYVASGDVRDGVTYTSKGPPSASGKTMPPATDSFLESIGTNTPYNIGKALGLGDFILSSPPSNRFNLQPFFNQAESQGTDNFLRSQQRDVLQLIKDGEFFTALAGKPIGGPLATDPLQSLDSYFDVQLGQEGLNEVLSQLQGLDDNDPTTGIDPSFEVDPFDTDSDSQVASITGDDEGTDADTETPEDTDPFVVRAYQGGGVGPFASNYIFQRFGYRPTETIDMLLRYDPVQELYFFENGQPVDPEFLQNMQLTKLDDEGQVVKDDDGKPVRMPKVVIEDDATTDEEEE